MKKFNYVYGPIPSRRLGKSVGISPIPKGHCNYSCIYCQLGRTRCMTNSREEYFNCQDIINEFKEYVDNGVEFDVATIVGEGEPLLYSKIGNLIDELKKLTDKPVAVITNGALLANPQVRMELLNADMVLPSLDATDEEMFKKINRPYGNIKFEKIVKGLKDFSNEYRGQIWVEIMLVKDVNDSKESLSKFKEILSSIRYDRLYINSPVRPPAEESTKPLSKEEIHEATLFLGGISIDELAKGGFYSGIEDNLEAVLSIIKRHPMNQFEIKSFIESRGEDNIEEFLDRLGSNSNVEVINYKNFNTYRLR